MEGARALRCAQSASGHRLTYKLAVRAGRQISFVGSLRRVAGHSVTLSIVLAGAGYGGSARVTNRHKRKGCAGVQFLPRRKRLCIVSIWAYGRHMRNDFCLVGILSGGANCLHSSGPGRCDRLIGANPHFLQRRHRGRVCRHFKRLDGDGAMESPRIFLRAAKKWLVAKHEFQIICSHRSGNQINNATQTTVSTPANAMSICGRARNSFVRLFRKTIARTPYQQRAMV